MTDEQRGFNFLCLLILVVIAITLCSCAATPKLAPPEPVVVTKEVKVAVPVQCKALSDLGAEPLYPDNDASLKAATDLFERVKLLLRGRVLRTARLAQYMAARASC